MFSLVLLPRKKARKFIGAVNTVLKISVNRKMDMNIYLRTTITIEIIMHILAVKGS